MSVVTFPFWWGKKDKGKIDHKQAFCHVKFIVQISVFFRSYRKARVFH